MDKRLSALIFPQMQKDRRDNEVKPDLMARSCLTIYAVSVSGIQSVYATFLQGLTVVNSEKSSWEFHVDDKSSRV